MKLTARIFGFKFMKLLLVLLYLILFLYIFNNWKSSRKIDQVFESKKLKELTGKIAVVVIACSRPTINRCLNSIINAKYYSNPNFDYFISHGCNDKNIERQLLEYKKYFQYLHFTERENFSKDLFNEVHRNYKKISHHYNQMFKYIFDSKGYEKVIIIEDDIEISADFFEYFLTMEKLFEKDPMLFCISAWNDNGSKNYARDPYKFSRTHFFPGLGWMISYDVWKEIKNNWPDSYWDDWMRSKEIIRNRSCIIPQISRVYNFGLMGVSGKIFYKKYIEVVIKNTHEIAYEKVNIESLMPQVFDAAFIMGFYKSEIVTFETFKSLKHESDEINDYRIEFNNWNEFKDISGYFSIPSNGHYNIARTSYYNIIQLNSQHYNLYIYPNFLPIPPNPLSLKLN